MWDQVLLFMVVIQGSGEATAPMCVVSRWKIGSTTGDPPLISSSALINSSVQRTSAMCIHLSINIIYIYIMLFSFYPYNFIILTSFWRKNAIFMGPALVISLVISRSSSGWTCFWWPLVPCSPSWWRPWISWRSSRSNGEGKPGDFTEKMAIKNGISMGISSEYIYIQLHSM